MFLNGLRAVASLLARTGMLTRDEARRFSAIRLPISDAAALCHSDFQSGQCVLRGQRISAVVDWESAWSGDPWIDLAIAQAHLELNAPTECAEALLSGYSSSHPVPTDYDAEYLPARLACLLGLIQVWLVQGGQSWAYARRSRRVQRTLDLFRAHLSRLEA